MSILVLVGITAVCFLAAAAIMIYIGVTNHSMSHWILGIVFLCCGLIAFVFLVSCSWYSVLTS